MILCLHSPCPELREQYINYKTNEVEPKFISKSKIANAGLNIQIVFNVLTSGHIKYLCQPQCFNVFPSLKLQYSRLRVTEHNGHPCH